MDGFLGLEDIRESLKTRDWQKATNQIMGWESRGSKEEENKAELVTIAQAWNQFQADAQARGLRPRFTNTYCSSAS